MSLHMHIYKYIYICTVYYMYDVGWGGHSPVVDGDNRDGEKETRHDNI